MGIRKLLVLFPTLAGSLAAQQRSMKTKQIFRTALLLSALYLLSAVSMREQSIFGSGCVNDGNGSTATCTLTGLLPHQTIVVGRWTYGNGGGSPSDTFGTTWGEYGPVNQYRAGPTDDFFAVFYGSTGTNSGTDVITGGLAIVVEVLTGVDDSVAADGGNCTPGTSGGAGTVSSGNFSTLHSGDFIWGAGFNAASANPVTAGTGFTAGNTVEAHLVGDAGPILAENKIAGTAGTYSATETTSAAGIYLMCGLAFKPAAPTAPATQIGGFIAGP